MCSQRDWRSSKSSRVGVICGFIVIGTKNAGCSLASRPEKPGRATPMMVIGVALTTTGCPTTRGARLKRRCQNASLRTTTGWPPLTTSSAAVKKRPSAGVAPSTSNVLPETISATTRSPGVADAERHAGRGAGDERAEAGVALLQVAEHRVRERAVQRRCGRGTCPARRAAPGRPALDTASARSTTWSSSEKIAVLAPMPRASVRTTTSGNPGARPSDRSA